jgi:hypothetical protein
MINVGEFILVFLRKVGKHLPDYKTTQPEHSLNPQRRKNLEYCMGLLEWQQSVSF